MKDLVQLAVSSEAACQASAISESITGLLGERKDQLVGLNKYEADLGENEVKMHPEGKVEGLVKSSGSSSRAQMRRRTTIRDQRLQSMLRS